jgi:Flp pilus assembly protein TadD
VTVEEWSRSLANALDEYRASPTVEQELELAWAYAAEGVSDKAHEHFAAVTRLDPREGAAWDALGRIWRDAGFSRLGLGDAYRAVAFAPRSPAAHNTLGTILQDLGESRMARDAFSRALALDPSAAYAQNNICYSWLLEGDVEAASAACERALALDPERRSVRNNLALAKALGGDLAGAEALFAAGSDEAIAKFNIGLFLQYQGRYADAEVAFQRALMLQPTLTRAALQARRARRHADTAPNNERASHERR